jgi:hypothetical protein
MAAALEVKYRATAAAAREWAKSKYPKAEIIISFGDHDCIVDVLDPDAGSQRFVYLEDA